MSRESGLAIYWQQRRDRQQADCIKVSIGAPIWSSKQAASVWPLARQIAVQLVDLATSGHLLTLMKDISASRAREWGRHLAGKARGARAWARRGANK